MPAISQSRGSCRLGPHLRSGTDDELSAELNVSSARTKSRSIGPEAMRSISLYVGDLRVFTLYPGAKAGA